LSFGQLLSCSPRPEGLPFVLRGELKAGRVRREGDHFQLVREAFAPGLLEAIAEVRP
jgi:hypothetical protein